MWRKLGFVRVELALGCIAPCTLHTHVLERNVHWTVAGWSCPCSGRHLDPGTLAADALYRPKTDRWSAAAGATSDQYSRPLTDPSRLLQPGVQPGQAPSQTSRTRPLLTFVPLWSRQPGKWTCKTWLVHAVQHLTLSCYRVEALVYSSLSPLVLGIHFIPASPSYGLRSAVAGGGYQQTVFVYRPEIVLSYFFYFIISFFLFRSSITDNSLGTIHLCCGACWSSVAITIALRSRTYCIVKNVRQRRRSSNGAS